MKKVLFLAILLYSVQLVFSVNITKEQASKVARNFYFQKVNQFQKTLYSDIKTDQIFEKKSANKTLYYIINFSYNGFVVVSGDTRITPVLGFSFDSKYSELNQPQAFIHWMKDYASQIEWIIENGEENNNFNALWDLYLTDNQSLLLSSKSSKSVAPLLRTKWNQDKYYNNACPLAAGGPDGRCYAGCVPTAMGQIMNYYRHPVTGTGSYTYTHPDYGVQTADFGNTTYAWDKMPIEVEERSNDSAVALLLYHLGVSVDLDYGPQGSGMFNHKAAFALRNNFKYSPDCEYIFRDTANNTNWKQLILSHLDDKKPLYYAGWADTINVSGHAFVCDGYQDTTYFHFNWGWGGSFDGYFMIDNLTPGGSNFTLDHELILNFYPDPVFINSCQPTSVLTNTEGVIGDGSGPLKNYRKNSDCSWLIKPSDSVVSIKLYFLDFKTESDSDKVIIYKGETTSAPVLAMYSGVNIPATLTTSEKVLLIRFMTNDTIESDGWLIQYQVTTPVFCSGLQNLTAWSGTISDGSGDFNYHPNQVCRWNIQPAGATSILLQFSDFNLAPGDNLKVTDVINNIELADLTGSALPANIICNSGRLYLMLRTYDNIMGQGFKASYTVSNSINTTDKTNTLVSVFPNPVHDELLFSHHGELSTEVVVTIFKLDGVKVLEKSFPLNSEQVYKLNVENLAGGMYIASFTLNNSNIFKKIIKH